MQVSGLAVSYIRVYLLSLSVGVLVSVRPGSFAIHGVEMNNNMRYRGHYYVL